MSLADAHADDVPVEWARMTAAEINALSAAGATVILPVAAIEQHGPHLPTMTDTRLGHEIAVRAARRSSRPAVVTPVVWSGISEHHMAFGGTLTLSPETFHEVLCDLVRSLVRHGFSRILIQNSHGGNIVAIQSAAASLAMELDAIVIATTTFAEAAPEISGILEAQDRVMHACEAETSMMLALEAALVNQAELATSAGPPTSPGLAGRAGYRWRPFEAMTPNGVLGNPAVADAAKGEAILEACADAMAALIDHEDAWAKSTDLRDA